MSMNWLTNILLFFAAPGEKLPPGTVQPPSLEAEGLGWGWAFFLAAMLTAGEAWAYRRFAGRLAWPWRAVLTALKVTLLAVLALLLTRPVLHLTVDESVRHPLLVLLDQSQSMGLADRRDALKDLTRAALAKGDLSPAAGLSKAPADSQLAGLKQLSRKQLLEYLAANEKMDLWRRLREHADLEVYGFGRKAAKLGDLTGADAAMFFTKVAYEENVTALGDALRQVLDELRGQPLAGILVITDGASNTGAPPVEAAAVAKQDGVPLFLYGVGVTSPQDLIVSGVTGPATTNARERVEFIARVKSQGMMGKKAVVQLKADGRVVASQPLEPRADGEQEITLGYQPETTGEVAIEALVAPLPEEALKDNNSAVTKVRVVDDKINVLLVQQEPNWDFEYLLVMLRRDRRVKVQCVVLKGDQGPDAPFLDGLPADKKELFKSDVIILSDADPTVLGASFMEALREWVDKIGGGLVLVAGRRFLPNTYAGTPLEPLLPVEPLPAKVAQTYTPPVALTLTPAGEGSAMLELSDNPVENRALWKKMPGLSWTAWVGNARPGAQVLLADPTPERVTRAGAMPVMATQNFGLGQTLYVGTGQTHRWRHKVGEKYFARVWHQMLQTLANQKVAGKTLTQLRTDRPRYATGERVRISGRLFKAGFEALTDAEAPGLVVVKPADGRARNVELRLQSIPDRPGEYRGEFVAPEAGEYAFSTLRDPATVLKFEVAEPRVEFTDMAMNEKLLREMAVVAGGELVREEDLNKLPGLVKARTARNTTFKTIPLNFTPWLLALLLVCAAGEWWLRRKLELK
ncbi:MAG: hypothetical protein LBK60_05545 [Verrucomicrobiales bacterium]|jgi:hypothetical protein|nr:hypothetical protein [Verrucomicrobiales bacterium]